MPEIDAFENGPGRRSQFGRAKCRACGSQVCGPYDWVLGIQVAEGAGCPRCEQMSMSLRYAYNTNGTARHRLDDALVLMAEAGYDGVALTLDNLHLDPFATDWERNAIALRKRLADLGLAVVIETGALFLLDPRRKHEPTLISPTAAGRAERLAFLKRAFDIGAIIEAESVTFWGGRLRDDVDARDATPWLHEGVAAVVDYAKSRGVVPALEPEPEMTIATTADYARLLSVAPDLRLALDLGHVMVTNEQAPEDAVLAFGDRLASVHIEDMKRHHHLHLPFGQGDMNIPASLQALEQVGFGGLVCVELSRDSHQADVMIRQARQQLAAYERQGKAARHVEPAHSVTH